MLVEDPFDEEDTREFVCGILMEALSSQCDIDGAVGCDSLFALLDGINTTIDNPIVTPPTYTKIRLTLNTNMNTNTNTNVNTNTNRNTKKTRMQPKDRQVPVISNNNTNKKKKKKRQK